MEEIEKVNLIQILTLHFAEGLTQSEIARQFGVSNTIISRKINKGRKLGLVKYFFKDETAYTVNLERTLERQFSLQEVIVVPSFGKDLSMIEYEAAKAAAFYVTNNLHHLKSIGLTWGKALWRFIQELPYQDNKDLHIVPLCGGIGATNLEIHSNALSLEMARHFSCNYSQLYAPAITQSFDLKNQLSSLQAIADILEKGRSVDLAIVGIGDITRASTMREVGYLKKNSWDLLHSLGAVGDIGCMYFDNNGIEIQSKFNKKVVGITLSSLKNIKNVMAIAYGLQKKDAVLGALKGQYINTLVIDSDLAAAILTAN
ncbi:sugar-binding transcriptional regulator [Pectinatus haikarae]|uniref:DNA-binding transcriptional regulator LsrR (DeoR family) n=1 Tax=Pectinatus haikarae TaxID=349096 RepID=A0ABT9Y5I0_9FIRM|nr:sugar-binding transcriptional regulator [Pectinatus haikarae]MDQ0202888.1 DNA-binding transcriptional regulator LsrR (DeoR family) [Pectinatus haikarae]